MDDRIKGNLADYLSQMVTNCQRYQDESIGQRYYDALECLRDGLEPRETVEALRPWLLRRRKYDVIESLERILRG